VYFYFFTIVSPWKRTIPFFWTNFNPFAQEQFVPSLVKIGPMFLEKIFKWPRPFLLFCNYLPFEEDLALYLNKLEFPSSKDNLYQVWLNLACWFWRRFLKIVSAFSLFCYYLPLERGYPLSSNKLKSPLPKDDLCQVWLKLAKWFWRRFLNDATRFLHFCDYFPFEKDLALYLNKLEFPSPKDNLYQVWLNLAGWFWRF
jgi:hypothetical protein